MDRIFYPRITTKNHGNLIQNPKSKIQNGAILLILFKIPFAFCQKYATIKRPLNWRRSAFSFENKKERGDRYGRARAGGTFLSTQWAARFRTRAIAFGPLRRRAPRRFRGDLWVSNGKCFFCSQHRRSKPTDALIRISIFTNPPSFIYKPFASGLLSKKPPGNLRAAFYITGESIFRKRKFYAGIPAANGEQGSIG